MSRTLASPSAGSTIVDKLKVYEGGTGAATATAAAAALSAIPLSQIGVPGGIAGLNSSGKLDSSSVTDDSAGVIAVQGPTSCIIGVSQNYEITNYDVFTTYDLQSARGTVARNGSTIVYKAPSSIGDGSGGFTINGRTINIPTVGIKPNTPTLLGNSNGGSSTAPAVNGAGTAYSSNLSSSGYTHLNSDWQLASDAAFTTIVAQNLADATNKIAYTFKTGLAASTTYYLRVRYRDSNNGVSDWSNVVSVTTPATYFLRTEEARLVAPTPSSAGYFASRVAISEFGDRVAVCEYTSTRKVYIFVRSGSTWTLETTLTETDNNYGSYGVAISNAGDVLVVCGLQYLYVYTRSGSTWTKGSANGCPGYSNNYWQMCAISGDGTRVAATYSDQVGGQYQGTVRVFTRSGGNLSYSYDLSSPSGSSAWFGYGISMSTDGTYVACQCANGDSAGYVFFGAGLQGTFSSSQTITNNDEIRIAGTGDRLLYLEQAPGTGRRLAVYRRSGTTWSFEQYLGVNPASKFAINKTGDQVVVYDGSGTPKVFTRSGNVWTQVATLTGSSTSSNDNSSFGSSLAISGDGTRGVVAAYAAKSSNVANAGAAYIFST